MSTYPTKEYQTYEGYPGLTENHTINALGSRALTEKLTLEDLNEADRHRITAEMPQTD